MQVLVEMLIYFIILALTVTISCYFLGIKEATHKYKTLDGLRGLAAALVAIFHIYWRAGDSSDRYWSLNYLDNSTLKRAIMLVGEIPVSVFFMLSGFLFFTKILSSNNFNTKDFFISRAIRIYPPVLASMLVIYLVTAFINGGQHLTSPLWFLHALPFLSEYKGTMVNNFPINITNSGVFWTLVWENRLYLSIPIIALIINRTTYKKTILIITMLTVITIDKAHLVDKAHAGYIMFFLVGFLVASLNEKQLKYQNIITALLMVIAIFFTRYAYSTTTALYLLPVFYLIRNGSDLFGILTSRPFRLLGTCSFSIYLLHGITQTFSKHFLFNQGNYLWQVCSLVAVGVLAPIMYKLIESRCFYRPSIPSTVTS